MRTSRAVMAGVSVAAAGAAWKLSERAARRALVDRVPARKSVLILGGGFAGAHAAQSLRHLLPADALEVTVISSQTALVFTPLLAETAGGDMPAVDTLTPLAGLLPDVRLVHGSITEIDLKSRRATVELAADDGATPRMETFTGDHLVIALGSRTDYHNIPGVREHSFAMKSAEDAARLRAHILGCIESARSESDPEVRRALLTFVVGGAGFTGVETMAAVNAMVRATANDRDGVNSDEIRTVLVDAVDRLLPEVSEGLSKYAMDELTRAGVELRLSTRVTGAGDGYVMLAGERMDTHTLIWSGGIEPPPVVKNLVCRHGLGHALAVTPTLAVSGYPGVWAVGDSAVVPMAGGGSYTPLAQNAQKEGDHVAANIVAEITGRNPKPFTYHTLGQLALVGPRAGIAEMPGIHITGLAAWLLWHAAYLTRIPTNAQRARVALDWVAGGPAPSLQ